VAVCEQGHPDERDQQQRVAEAQIVDINDPAQPAVVDDHVLGRDAVQERGRLDAVEVASKALRRRFDGIDGVRVEHTGGTNAGTGAGKRCSHHVPPSPMRKCAVIAHGIAEAAAGRQLRDRGLDGREPFRQPPQCMAWKLMVDDAEIVAGSRSSTTTGNGWRVMLKSACSSAGSGTPLGRSSCDQ
jgi:hypothetical protein